MPPMTSGFQRTTSDNSGRKIAAHVDFKGFDGLSRMVWEVLMVRRPDSNIAFNPMLKSNKI